MRPTPATARNARPSHGLMHGWSPDAPRARKPPPAWQLDVITEMLATMDTLTAAGQKHLMRKIVKFFRSEAAQARYAAASEGKRRSWARLLDGLEANCGREVPDEPAFCRRVGRLVCLLRDPPSKPGATGR